MRPKEEKLRFNVGLFKGPVIIDAFMRVGREN